MVRYVSAALVISLGTILFVQVGSDDLNSALDEAGVRTLEEERLDKVLTGAPTEVSETEAALGAEHQGGLRERRGGGHLARLRRRLARDRDRLPALDGRLAAADAAGPGALALRLLLASFFFASGFADLDPRHTRSAFTSRTP